MIEKRPTVRRGRHGMESLLHRPGPAILVAVVAAPDGRWAAELTAPTAEASAVCGLIGQRLDTGETSLRPTKDSPRVIGVAALVSWEYVYETASSQDTHLLMAASASLAHRTHRAFPRFLEHRILASAILDEPVPLPGHTCWAPTMGSWPAILDPSSAIAVASRPVLLMAGPGVGARVLSSQALSTWASCFEASSTSLTPWPAWTPLATALIEGRWAGDVTTLGKLRCLPPVRPARGQLQAFQRHPLQHVPAAPRPSQASEVSQPFIVLNPRRGSVQAFSAVHAINALRIGQTLANQGSIKVVAEASLRFWFPEEWQGLLADRQQAGHRTPSKEVLRALRVKLDITAMLLWRRWYLQHRPTYRYMGVDASPQRPGVEVLAVAERVIPRSELKQLQPGQLWPTGLIQRRLPVACLGHGRAGLADKVQAVVHATWLEYGPSLDTLAQANLDVRQVLTDMGTELGIADAAAVGSLCVPTKRPPSWSSSSRPVRDRHALLFPLALGIPGMQHILDSILRDSLCALSWWPAWQAQAKALSQWLGYENHRDFLQQLLASHGEGAKEYQEALHHGVATFAAWRWHTLAAVTADLCRLERPVRAAMGNLRNAAELGSRDSTHAQAVWQAVKDEEFWAKACGLQMLVQPFKELSGWIRGCCCHEAELRQGREVQCPWKGCRARELVPRLRAFQHTLTAFRDNPAASPCPGLSPSEVSAVVTRQLAMLRIKTQWAHEPPFLVWQCDKPEVASSFLDMHDQQVRSGGQPHRVTQHFAGPTSPLRSHMEAFAAGQHMSAILRSEVLSYQCCMLDDTWVEAVHRDLSGTGRKKPMAKMPFRFASLRLGQNLELYDSVSASERNAFEKVIWPRWRAIAREATPRIPLRPLWDCPRLSTREVRIQVYRLGQAALVDWAASLPPLTSARGPTGEPGASPEWANLLQSDFLMTLLELLGPEPVLSIPSQEDSWSPNPSPATTQQLRFFQVVLGAEVRRKKQLRTAWSTRMGGMVCPSMIQNMAIWANRGGDTWDVYPDGNPDLEDLARCAPWKMLRCDMSFWSLVPADTAGCVQCGNPKKVMDISWDLRNGPVPLVVLLEYLARAGWKRASSAKDSPAMHTLETPRVMHLSGSTMQDKAFLQCLACLEDILSPSLPSLATGQPAAYYQKILQSQLEQAVHLPTCPGSSNHEARARDSSEEEPVLEHPAGNRPTQPTPRASRKRKPTEAVGINEVLLVPLQAMERSGPAEKVAKAAPPLVGHPAASSSSSALPVATSDDRPANTGQERIGQSRGRAAAAQPRDILANVEGVDIVRDTHLLPGMHGHYERARVRCPLHSGSGVLCTKTRIFGRSSTATFGQQEPVAFLASWVCAASRFTDRASHMRYAPGQAEVCVAMANLRNSGVEG